MLEELKQEVFRANLDLVRYNLVLFTWGNVSAVDRSTGLVIIKPSGVEYDRMKVSDLVVVDMQGKVVEGSLNPSSDTPTHLEIYKAFPEVNGVVHTHSTYATAWAQARKSIPVTGTTHADYFHGAIPCTRVLTSEEVNTEYECNTGKVIVEIFEGRNPLHTPGVLVSNHGPFTWGKSAQDAVYHSVVLEEIARMGFVSKMLNPLESMSEDLVEKHFNRKHGANAYYGQKKG